MPLLTINIECKVPTEETRDDIIHTLETILGYMGGEVFVESHLWDD